MRTGESVAYHAGRIVADVNVQPIAADAPPDARGSWLGRLPTALVVLATALMVVGALAFAWLVAWLLLLSLASFLTAPESPLDPLQVALPIVFVPPLVATAATVVLVARRVRGVTNARVRILAWERDASAALTGGPSVAWTLVLLGVGCLGFLGYERLVFLFHRIHGAIDEGLYLYAARLVMAGQIPYRDFYYDQAPLLPFAFGLALAPFQYNEVAARLFAIGCTLATLLVAFWTATRLGGRLAGLVAFALLVTNLDFLPEVSAGVTANGSLTALVAVLSILALTYDRLVVALVLAVVAAGLRQVFIPLPVVVACYVAIAKRRPWTAVLAGLAPLVAIYLGFLAIGGPAAPYGMIPPLRMEKVVRVASPVGLRYELISFRDQAMRVLEAYLPFWLCAGPVAYVMFRRGHPRGRLLLTLAAACALVLLANIFPYVGNPRYPVSQLPLVAVLGGVAVASVLRRAQPGSVRPALAAALAMLLVAAPLLAFRSSTFIDEYHAKPPLERFLSASAYVTSVAGPNATLVTLETPFATQTGARLPHGLEAGSWGVYKGISEDEARALGVVTYKMLVDMVEQRVGDVVIESDRYGFVKNYISNDDQKARLEAALKNGYELKETFGAVSDWGDVRVWVRKPG
jgi:hypothetical protein